MADKDDSPKTTFNSVSGLWSGRGKVAYNGRTREEVVIPKGAKLLAFRNTNANSENRQPSLNLVWVIEEDN